MYAICLCFCLQHIFTRTHVLFVLFLFFAIVAPKEWLVATGNLRQVLDLVNIAEKARGSGSTNANANAGVASGLAVAGAEAGAEQTSTPTKTSPSQQQPR